MSERAFLSVAALALLALSPLGARAGEEELKRDLSYLASDELEGRGTATKGGALAADYVEKQMKAAGLEPRRERFPFLAGVKVGPGTGLDVRVSTEKYKSVSSSMGDGKEFRPLGFSANGRADGALVFCGFGISAPEAGFDEYAGVDVKGKVVLILDRTPRFKDGHGPLSKDAAPRYGQLRYKIMTAREKGAVAVLITSSDPEAAKDQDPTLLPLSGGAFSSDAGILAADWARSRVSVFSNAGFFLDQLQREIEEQGAPRSRDVEGVTVTLSVDLVKEQKFAENVYAIRPGTDASLAQEAIIVGAHMDHLGHGEVGGSLADDPSKHEIHNGADDNGSGTVALLDLARRLPKTRHPVVFIAFSGEEMGLLGSAAYVKEPALPLEKAPVMINMDMVGRLERKKLTVGGMGTADEWTSLVPECAKKAGLEIAPESDGYGPSDHSSFYGKGVPVLFLFTGAHADYHKPSDDWQKIDFAGLDRITGFAKELVVAVDALEKRPTPRASAGNPHGGELEPSRGPSVYLGTIPDYSATERAGVRLTGVREGSPASAAGLKAGDWIVSFDGHEVRDVQDYTYVLFAKKPGDRVAIVVERGEDARRVTLEATMGRKGGAPVAPSAPSAGEPTLPPGHPPVEGLPPGHPPIDKKREPVLF